MLLNKSSSMFGANLYPKNPITIIKIEINSGHRNNLIEFKSNFLGSGWVYYVGFKNFYHGIITHGVKQQYQIFASEEKPA